MWKIFAVKTLYRIKAIGKPKAIDKDFRENLDLLEERIVLIKARNFDEAIIKGEKEAKEYVSFDMCLNPYGQKVKQEYIGAIDVFEPFDEIKNKSEIFSSTHLIKSSLSNDAIVDKIFGKEMKNEKNLRKKFLNQDFSGVVKQNNA